MGRLSVSLGEVAKPCGLDSQLRDGGRVAIALLPVPDSGAVLVRRGVKFQVIRKRGETERCSELEAGRLCAAEGKRLGFEQLLCLADPCPSVIR